MQGQILIKYKHTSKRNKRAQLPALVHTSKLLFSHSAHIPQSLPIMLWFTGHVDGDVLVRREVCLTPCEALRNTAGRHVGSNDRKQKEKESSLGHF